MSSSLDFTGLQSWNFPLECLHHSLCLVKTSIFILQNQIKWLNGSKHWHYQSRFRISIQFFIEMIEAFRHCLFTSSGISRHFSWHSSPKSDFFLYLVNVHSFHFRLCSQWPSPQFLCASFTTHCSRLILAPYKYFCFFLTSSKILHGIIKKQIMWRKEQIMSLFWAHAFF